MTFTLGSHEEQIFSDLRRTHLRHPGMVKKTIVKLFARDTVTSDQVAMARAEWLRLGLQNLKTKGATDAHG